MVFYCVLYQEPIMQTFVPFSTLCLCYVIPPSSFFSLSHCYDIILSPLYRSVLYISDKCVSMLMVDCYIRFYYLFFLAILLSIFNFFLSFSILLFSFFLFYVSALFSFSASFLFSAFSLHFFSPFSFLSLPFISFHVFSFFFFHAFLHVTLMFSAFSLY